MLSKVSAIALLSSTFPVNFPENRENGPKGHGASSAEDSPHRQNKKGPFRGLSHFCRGDLGFRTLFDQRSSEGRRSESLLPVGVYTKASELKLRQQNNLRCLALCKEGPFNLQYKNQKRRKLNLLLHPPSAAVLTRRREKKKNEN